MISAVSCAGLPLRSPYLTVLSNKQAQIMLKAGAELGFSPASRTRVQVVGDITNNPFARNGVRYNPVYPTRKPWELPAADDEEEEDGGTTSLMTDDCKEARNL